MNDFTVSLSGAQLWSKSRSIGMKLIVICALALLMVIPSFFVAGLIEDRTKRKLSQCHQGNIQPRRAAAKLLRTDSRNSFHHSTSICHGCPVRGMYLISPAKASTIESVGAPPLTIQGAGVSGRLQV